MNLQDVLVLMDRFDASSVTSLELELEQEQARIKLQKGGAVVPQTTVIPTTQRIETVQMAPVEAPPVPTTSQSFITAPLVGTFYSCTAPGEAPFAGLGATVKKGQTVCVLEAMKMMSEIPAPADCVIEEVLVADGALVGYGEQMFRVREL